jgi:hypothetical protein
MQGNTFIKILSFIMVIIFFVPTSSFAVKVDGYEALSKLLPGGILKKDINKKEIEDTQQYLILRQKKKKKRGVKFLSPIDFFQLNEKYMAISFNVKIQSKTKNKDAEKQAIFTILFKRSEEKEFEGTKYFLGWVNEKDFQQYKSIKIEYLCNYFRNIGVQDCVPAGQEKIAEERTGRSKPLDAKYVGKADIIHTHSGGNITSGKIKAVFIDNEITRDSELVTELAKKADIKHAHEDILNKVKELVDSGSNHNHKELYYSKTYVDKLKNQIEELNKTVNNLSGLVQNLSKTTQTVSNNFKDVYRKGNDIFFKNVNVHIINGKGATNKINGYGNLIVGYNESRSKGNVRKGSHNVVVGSQNNYNSYGGLVTGENNTISEVYSCISGGHSNIASGKYSSVVGGKENKAKGEYSHIGGGLNRSVSGTNPHFQ